MTAAPIVSPASDPVPIWSACRRSSGDRARGGQGHPQPGDALRGLRCGRDRAARARQVPDSTTAARSPLGSIRRCTRRVRSRRPTRQPVTLETLAKFTAGRRHHAHADAGRDDRRPRRGPGRGPVGADASASCPRLSTASARVQETATALVGADGRFAFLNVPSGAYTSSIRDPRRSSEYVYNISGPAPRLPIAPGLNSFSSSVNTIEGAAPGVQYGSSDEQDPARAFWAHLPPGHGRHDRRHRRRHRAQARRRHSRAASHAR